MKRFVIGLLVLGVACDDGDDGETTSSGSSGSTTSDSTTATTMSTSTSDPSTSSSTAPGTTSAGSSSGDQGVDPMVLALCQCLLINCHDPYHLEYGVSDVEAEMACTADGSSIPLQGEGDTVDCRLTACSMSDCEAGLGLAAPCLE